jgi:hypothetical protein
VNSVSLRHSSRRRPLKLSTARASTGSGLPLYGHITNLEPRLYPLLLKIGSLTSFPSVWGLVFWRGRCPFFL